MLCKGFDVIKSLLEYVCKGDENGVKIGMDLWEVMHFWDDIVDKDYPDAEYTNKIMQKILFELPLNPLYGHPALMTTLSLAVSNWLAANQFEEHKVELEKAYMMRAFPYNIFITLANIIGGQEWANKVAPQVWLIYGENLETFKQEVANA